MSEELPSPLVPADVDLRDFSFMPLEVARLRDSNLAAVPDGEVFRANILSWCVAWHQVPAASLPDDDPTLARMLGYGRDLRTWRKVRSGGGLRGWIKCADGRLYHPVVAAKALDAWASKQAQRQRTEAARLAKQQKQQQALSQTTGDLLSQTHAPPVTASKGQGQGELRDRDNRTEDSASGKPRGELTAKQLGEFEAWWQHYPKRVARKEAERAFVKARKSATVEQLIAGAKRYVASITDPKFTAHPATWLNAGRWSDEGPATSANGHAVPERRAPSVPPPPLAEGWDRDL